MRTIFPITEKNISKNLWLVFLVNEIKVKKYNRERHNGLNNVGPNCVSFKG